MKSSGEERKRYKGDVLLILLIATMAGLLFSSFLPGSPIWLRESTTDYLGIIFLFFLLAFLLCVIVQFEERQVSSWQIALIGVMGAASAASRIPFVILPSVQPCTVIIISVGLVFGWRMGFMVGIITALLSNLFLPMGPWALWQMFAWGLGGMFGGVVGKMMPRAGVATLVTLAVLWGIIYGVIIDIYTLGIFLSAGDPLTWSTLAKTYLPALPFNLLHLLGNIVFAVLLGPSLLWVFRRFRRRNEWVKESAVEG